MSDPRGSSSLSQSQQVFPAGITETRAAAGGAGGGGGAVEGVNIRNHLAAS